IGAVIYADLQNNRIKDIDFSWDRALSFEGETGPYVQYTHARCCSVLRRAAELDPAEPEYAALEDDYAQELLRPLSRFPAAVREAAERYEPSIMTRTVTELCKAYNKFYYENRILDAESGVREARVRLTTAVRQTIKTGLYLIGMEAPERM
ncbi:MAG: DALR anticodon-binding domain-containing protein, partial [Clostridia bacterium]